MSKLCIQLLLAIAVSYLPLYLFILLFKKFFLVCVCVRAPVHTFIVYDCVGVSVEARSGHPVSSSIVCHLIFEAFFVCLVFLFVCFLKLNLDLADYISWASQQSLGTLFLCLPGAGTACVCCHTRNFMWMLGSRTQFLPT